MVTRGMVATINDNQMDRAVPRFFVETDNLNVNTLSRALTADCWVKQLLKWKWYSDVWINLCETAFHTDGDGSLKVCAENHKTTKKNCGQSRRNLLQLKGLIISYTAEFYLSKCQMAEFSSEVGYHFWEKENAVSLRNVLFLIKMSGFCATKKIARGKIFSKLFSTFIWQISYATQQKKSRL